jgi:DNA-binding transcriptional LysR family regulator
VNVTLKQLRYFDAALRTGSIAAAATEMHISQSSITAAIDAVEQSVGGELFRRVPAKGLTATESGRLVGARIAQFLEQSRIFEADLMSVLGDPAGMLHMGCYAPTAPYVLPRLLKRLSALHPGIRVDLKEGDFEAMVARLQSGAIDLALTYRRTVPEGMAFDPLFVARPWAVLAEDSPLAAQASVTLHDLAPLPMVLLDLPTTETYFRKVFADHDLSPQVVHRTKSSSVLRGLVASGFGYSILNICGPTDRTGATGYVARPITGRLDCPEFGVAYSPATRRASIVEAALSVARSLAEENAFDDLIMQP